MYEVILRSRRVQKELDDLPVKNREPVLRRLQALADNPRPARCEKLEGDIYRIRVADHRVIYLVDDERRLVYVGAVRRRSEATYRGVRDLFR
ncbi:MAG: type II toxin-antitoxin system RelE/ParE family toxin [Chloroflexi bacterium]|nr:type II toxin-antitoxin system RelE/ParE family toxin [Chloroflexota bacterium]